MDIQPLHSWDLAYPEARALQTELAKQVLTEGPAIAPKIVAGADISMERSRGQAFAAVVLLEYPSLKQIATFTLEGTIHFPYVSGLLSFREGPLLLELFSKVEPPADVIFFDGQGIAHPRGLGIASHLGLFLNRPTIGVGKSKLLGDFREPGKEKGAHTALTDNEGKTIGRALRTRNNCKPVFVSVGHKIDLETATRLTLACAPRYRIPEPTRQAHLAVNEFRVSSRGK